jgi:hypothetical protein
VIIACVYAAVVVTSIDHGLSANDHTVTPPVLLQVTAAAVSSLSELCAPGFLSNLFLQTALRSES